MSRAPTLVPKTETASPSAAALAAAGDHLRQRRWIEAARLLETLPHRDIGAGLQLNMARNMHAMQLHRPAVYAQLVASRAAGRCRFVPTASNVLTIERTNSRGQRVLLSAGGDPMQALAVNYPRIRPLAENALSIAMCGLADGYLIPALLNNLKPTNPNVPGMWPTLFLIEPDLEVLTHCLMLHDYSAADGPIIQPWCVWCIGPNWREQMIELLINTPCLPEPSQVFDYGMSDTDLSAELAMVHRAIEQHETKLVAAVDAAYAPLTRDALASLFSATPPRRPRAMLLTSRYTTVLQHSTRDMAAGLEAIGWETRVMIESADHHQLPNRAIRQALLDFKPDAVMSIDHLRRERAGVVPANVPFVCWIQDDLLNLTNETAGLSITPRDFVLTCARPQYVRDYSYPARQCIYLQKLTSPAKRPEPWHADGDDLAFVSNASAVPELFAAEFLKEFEAKPEIHRLLRTLVEQLQSRYASGGTLDTIAGARRMIANAEAAMEMEFRAKNSREQLALWLFNHFNNLLYRQQALGWCVDIAERRGLKLGLYGAGWERNPRFAKLARGPVKYGRDLEELTRRTRINLQIVPFQSVHQRLLDGLVAGGFFLVRRHPVDTASRALDAFIQHELKPSVRSTPEARASLKPEARARFDSIVAAALDASEHSSRDDVVTAYREYEEQGLRFLMRGLPQLEEVSFDDAKSLEERIETYLSNPMLAREIWQKQCNEVEANWTYAGGLERVVRSMSDLIAGEGEPSAA